MWLFIITFISFTFWLAAISKLVNATKFSEALVQLQIPGANARPRVMAIVVITAEAVVGGLTLAGSVFTFAGLLLATGLMLVFTIVIGRILQQSIPQYCNCFGNTERPVNPLDMVRNIGLCACSITGICISRTAVQLPANKIEFGVIGVLSLAIAIVWANLGDIYHALKI